MPEMTIMGPADPQLPATDAVHTASSKKADKNAGVPQTVRRPIRPKEESGRGNWGH
ncbi:hypothetical protein [Mesorhizobium sp. LNHC252B00]|uniref:hypothetical protein n=1 Tax=Mesorhizobium sp. LNHC252B00 TaxID=1287252 RepID=UPI0012EC5BCF|nr:hypothetical protein [Mesorhizobium sp. LNHC252B00]